MLKVGKSEDLSHEEPSDVVLVKGEGHEQVEFAVLGARVQAVSRGDAYKRRNSATTRVTTALVVLLYTVALLAGFAGPAEVAYLTGASAVVALLVGGAGAGVVLGLVLLFNLRPRIRG
jgi:hypothetical protein